MPLPPALRDALLDALAVLSPVECAGCGRRDRAMCDGCRARLSAEVTARSLPGGLLVHTALRYESVARRSILAFKEQQRTGVARTLAVPLAAALATAHALDPAAELLAVPTSRAAWRRRGYDPVELLCRRAGFAPAKFLVSSRPTASQKTLGIADRAANMRGSMRARRSLVGRRFLLVDDVVTTGATLAEASRAVVEAGGEVASAVALAFTPRLFTPSATASAIPSDIADRRV